MTVESIMSSHLMKLQADDTVNAAMKMMHGKRVRNLPVVGEGDRFLGLFGVRQVVDLLLPRAAAVEQGLEDLSFMPDELGELYYRLAEVGERPVVDYVADKASLMFCAPSTPFPEVLELLSHKSLPVIVVDDNERLVGMVSAWNVFERLVMSVSGLEARSGNAG